MRLNKRTALAVGLVAVTAAALAGCSTSSSGSDTASSAAPTGKAIDLSGVCPANVVIQTDWNPEADHGHIYQLLGTARSWRTGRRPA
jgi:hypothetical protein